MFLKIQYVLSQNIGNDYQTKKYLLAVSGGIDSMVLLEIFKQHSLHFSVAHINYQLRGNDSDSDQELVEKFCLKHKIPFYTKIVNTNSEKPNQVSLQMFAREIRYLFFQELKQNIHYDYLVTAHHFNDSLETFFINFSRASGLKGLSGIPKFKENSFIRPLLDFSKQEIITFALEHNIQWNEDKSNAKDAYLRNKIRHKIIPELEKISLNKLENYKNSISILNETSDFLEEIFNDKKEKLVQKKEDYFSINKEQLKKEKDIVIREILSDFGFSEIEEIQKIFHSKIGSIFYSKNYKLLNDRELILISEISKVAVDTIFIEKCPFNIEFPIKIKGRIQNKIEPNADFILDAEKLIFPLEIRHKVEADYFYPLNLSGKKKLSKFLKDEKINQFDKEKIWLLCNGNQQIILVDKIRMDDRYKITSETKQYFCIYL